MPGTTDQTTGGVLEQSENRYLYDLRVPVFVRGAEGRRIDVQGRQLGWRGFTFQCAEPMAVGNVCWVYLRSVEGDLLPGVEATVIRAPQDADPDRRVDVTFTRPINLARFVDLKEPAADR